MTPEPDKIGEGRFRAYPKNRIVAILSSPADATTARDDLVAAGILAGSIDTFCGEAGIREIDFTGESRGILARIVRAVQDLGEVSEYKQRFEAALRAGECVLAVDAEDEGTRRLVHERLKARGARYINFFSPWSVERLEP